MSTTIKVIKNDTEHVIATELLSSLMESDAEEDDEKIELLALVIEAYENKAFPIEDPSPIDAIKFRMEQEGLTQRHLIPYIGSLSKVSEVLNGKRNLSLSMIRNLSHRLGISADVLIALPDTHIEETNIDWSNFPLAEMRKRNYFNSTESLAELKVYAEERVSRFLTSIKGGMDLTPALLKTTAHYRFNDKEVNQYALWIWQARILSLAAKSPLLTKYKKNSIDKQFMTDLSQLSWSDKGPIFAKEFLNKHGIHLVIEPHFKQTYLDGAVCTDSEGNPIIALTLRHDRLDNFWFSLLHEVSHIMLHMDKNIEWFLDDLDEMHQDPIEEQADRSAKNTLIPDEKWAIDSFETVKDITNFADSLKIHPSIVIGRLRREKQDYTLFARSLKIPKVRHFFMA